MEDKTKIRQHHVHFQYESKDGDLSGHCTGHGFTIVWNDRPPREYVTGPEVKDILEVCGERLEYIDEYATIGERKAYALITQAIGILQTEEDENWDGKRS